jgi:hypothetical protein
MEQEERTFRLRPDVIANTAEGIRCLLCPLLIWADGMTPDKSRNVSINNTHLMLGWFSPELMRQVSTKIELGYPPTWTWIPESVLLKHFLDQKCFSTKTRGRDEITEFKRSIELVFWERVLSYLEYSWTEGTPLKILGRNGTTTFLFESKVTSLSSSICAGARKGNAPMVVETVCTQLRQYICGTH